MITAQSYKWRDARFLHISRSSALAILALLFSIFLISPDTASAHAQLVATFPQDGSSIQSSPEVIVLSWGEDVQTSAKQFALVSQSGKKLTTKFSYSYDSTSREGTAKLYPASKLGKGSYFLSWKVISHDGHLVAGSIAFGVQTKVAISGGSPSTSHFDQAMQTLFWLLLILAFGALLSGRKKLSQRLILGAIAASIFRVIESYFEVHQNFLEVGSSKVSLLAILFLGFILISDRYIRSLPLLETKLEALILIGILFASQALFEGHSLDLANFNYLKYISAGHLLFALLWTGSVAALSFKPTLEQYAITRKLSSASIFLMVFLGGILTYVLSRPLKYADKTAWFTFIFVKGIFIAIALGLGVFHHYAGKLIEDEGSFTLKKTLLLEVVSVVGIAAATSLLVSYTPPKVVQAQYSISNNLNGAASAANFVQYPLKFDNGLTGTLYVQKAQAGSPAMMMLGIDSKAILGAKSVDLYLSNSALNIVDLHETLVGGSNQYMSYVTLPAAGSWRVNAQLLIDAFTQAQARVKVSL